MAQVPRVASRSQVAPGCEPLRVLLAAAGCQPGGALAVHAGEYQPRALHPDGVEFLSKSGEILIRNSVSANTDGCVRRESN